MQGAAVLWLLLLAPAAFAQVKAEQELPWLSSPEDTASRMLADARSDLAWGNVAEAERTLERLVAFYGKTRVAAAARADLRKLYARRLQLNSRNSLGVTSSPKAQEFDPLGPIAGWQAIVRPSGADRQDDLVEAAGDRVFFAHGSSRLGAKARRILAKQAAWLQSNPHVMVRIAGHADDQGSETRNQHLSRRRARVVRRRLIAEGVSPKRVTIVGLGRQQPIALCAEGACAAQNRRAVTEVVRNRRAGR